MKYLILIMALFLSGCPSSKEEDPILANRAKTKNIRNLITTVGDLALECNFVDDCFMNGLDVLLKKKCIHHEKYGLNDEESCLMNLTKIMTDGYFESKPSQI